MAKKADWSIVDAQMKMFKSRDSQDRQGRFSAPSPDRLRERAGRSGNSQFYNRTAYEHADVSGSGRQPGYSPGARGGRGNYDDPTVPTRSMASPPSPKSPTGMKRRQASPPAAYREADRSGIEAARDSRIARYGREEKAYNTRETYRAADAGIMHTQEEASHRAHDRQQAASRQQRQDQRAYGAADEGMNLDGLFQEDQISSRKRDSTIQAYYAADSAPLKDYKPRGKSIVDKKTNIQAFY